jgi:hypothetical protein
VLARFRFAATTRPCGYFDPGATPGVSARRGRSELLRLLSVASVSLGADGAHFSERGLELHPRGPIRQEHATAHLCLANVVTGPRFEAQPQGVHLREGGHEVRRPGAGRERRRQALRPACLRGTLRPPYDPTSLSPGRYAVDVRAAVVLYVAGLAVLVIGLSSILLAGWLAALLIIAGIAIFCAGIAAEERGYRE